MRRSHPLALCLSPSFSLSLSLFLVTSLSLFLQKRREATEDVQGMQTRGSARCFDSLTSFAALISVGFVPGRVNERGGDS